MPPDVAGETDVWFAIYGANPNLDAAGNVETVIDAGFIRDLCEAEGLRPDGVGA